MVLAGAPPGRRPRQSAPRAPLTFQHAGMFSVTRRPVHEKDADQRPGPGRGQGANSMTTDTAAAVSVAVFDGEPVPVSRHPSADSHTLAARPSLVAGTTP